MSPVSLNVLIFCSGAISLSVARSVSSSRGSYFTRSSSPCTRRIGGCPDTMCRSEAPVSNMSLKNASSFAMSPLAPLGGVRRDYKTFNEPMRSGRVKSRMASRLQDGGPDKAGLLIQPVGHHRHHRGEPEEIGITGV